MMTGSQVDEASNTVPRADDVKRHPPQSRRNRTAAVFDRLAEGRTFRLRVALAMAALSLVSAYVTYVASERDAAAADLNMIGLQQSAEEQQVEQQLDAIIAQDQRLTARLDQEWHTQRDATEEADAVRGTDAARAAQLDLQAQASAAHFDQLRPFLRAALPDFTGDAAEYDTEAAVANTRLQDARLFRASSALTRDQARGASATATSTVLIVVVLVAALFLLTLAHVIGGRRGLGLAALGVAGAIGGIIWFAVLDIGTASPLLIGAVIVAVALIVAQIPRVRAWLEGLEQDSSLDEVVAVPTRPGTTATTDPNDPPTTGFNRYVAIAIAVATLLGAGVGYVHGQASTSAADHAWRAGDQGVTAIGALRAAEERLTVGIETYQQGLARHVDAWNATQHAAYAAWSGDTLEAQRLTVEAQRLEELAMRHEKRSGLADRLGSAGASSEAVLRDLRADVWESSSRLAALQDASNAASRTWGVRAGIFLSVLAWLAVAAYLLGLSLIFRDRRVRIVLASVGTFLIVAAFVRSGTAVAEPGPMTGNRAEAAAEAYAAGVVAHLRSDPATAEKHFAEALRLRSDFGIASRERAQAILDTGSAPGLGIRAAFTKEAVDDAIASLEAARANGADTAAVNLNLGAMLFHRSIETGSTDDMSQSVAHTRIGLDMGEAYEDMHGKPHLNQLIGEMNLGLALLGTGDVDEAEEAYRTVSEHIGTLPPYLQAHLVSAALTPLDRLREADDPPSDHTISDMKELVVRNGYGVGTESPAQVDSLRVELFASIIQWRATIRDFDPGRDKLSVQWYRLDPAVDSWSALPTMSGPLTFGTVDLGGAFYADVTAGAYWGNSGAALTNVPPMCTQPGRYRVELYVNGSLHATAEAESASTSASASHTPLLARDVGVAMCQPPDWSVTRTPGLSTMATSADGSRGVAIIRVLQPRAPYGPDARQTVLDRVVWTGLTGVPGGLGSGFHLDPTAQPTVLGRLNSAWRLYEYPGGIAKLSATDLGSGIITVTCLYGPGEWANSAEATDLILSMIPY